VGTHLGSKQGLLGPEGWGGPAEVMMEGHLKLGAYIYQLDTFTPQDVV
jgi:hypothetical protein